MSTITLGEAILTDSTFNAADVAHRGFELEHDAEGKSYTFRFEGSQQAMLALVNSHSINEVHANYGKLKSVHLTQDVGPNWQAEFRFEIIHDNEGPDTSYGAKSCRLTGGMLSNDLNIHPDYRANWDHFLLAKGTSTVPAWWATATDISLSVSDASTYQWSRGEDNFDKDTWRVLKKPTKPGVRSYDLATYNIVESARFRNASAAGSMIQGKLNKIGTPSNTFGITGGNWKCERAEVYWSGKYWLATLEWVRSVDNDGWDTTLYGNGSGSSNNNS